MNLFLIVYMFTIWLRIYSQHVLLSDFNSRRKGDQFLTLSTTPVYTSLAHVYYWSTQWIGLSSPQSLNQLFVGRWNLPVLLWCPLLSTIPIAKNRQMMKIVTILLLRHHRHQLVNLVSNNDTRFNHYWTPMSIQCNICQLHQTQWCHQSFPQFH